VLAERGSEALVFRGEDGLDELSSVAPSRVWVVTGGVVTPERVDPAELGIAPATLADLRGGDARFNAGVVHEVLAGTRGPIRDAVLLNAAAALVACGTGAGTLTERLAAGMRAAATAVDSGASTDLLRRWVAASGPEPAGP